ncbi:hypothetical protein GQ53DRAFT_825620 [Thozetella sp. PMI_491]|nr:hypothetical protein GQ53DRAFT_825620 [Thozetella sp. PMI_491]
MFRDESTKVIQKAHASWGFEPAEASRSSEPSPISPSPSSSTPHDSPVSAASLDGSSSPSDHFAALALPRLSRAIDPTKVEQGIQFYLEHYLVGHPDEPRSLEELRKLSWIDSPGISEAMAAVGLAGMSNLHGNEELRRLSRQNYGLALQHTLRTLQNSKAEEVDLATRTRAVVMLAMFEVVKGTHEPSQGARTHIIGAASLIRSFAPWPRTLMGGMRGLLLLSCSLVSSVQRSLLVDSPEPEVLIPRQFIPCHVAGLSLPDTFFDWIKLGTELVPAVDRPAVDLLQILTEFVQLSAFVRGNMIVDGQSQTAGLLHQILDLEQRLDTWERQLKGVWSFSRIRADGFPADTVFRAQFHVYTDMWTARTWSHFRWCRILVNQMLLEFRECFPLSSQGFVSGGQCKTSLETIHRLAEDTLISFPTHWRHPRMSREQRDLVDDTSGGGPGIGAAGLPSTLFHLKVAACAPGVPHDHAIWTIRTLDTVWSDMGMLQAKALADLMRKEYMKKQAALADAGGSVIKSEPT